LPQAFDVLLLDLGLPDGRGTELVPLVRVVAPHAYIVAFTVFDDESHVIEAIEAGVRWLRAQELWWRAVDRGARRGHAWGVAHFFRRGWLSAQAIAPSRASWNRRRPSPLRAPSAIT
jgi:CheY-like chemotaxis protein